MANLSKPTPGGDVGTWGTKINAALDAINSELTSTTATAAAAETPTGAQNKVNTYAATANNIFEAKISRTGKSTNDLVGLAADGTLTLRTPASGTTINNATTSAPGIIQLSGVLAGTATSPTLATGAVSTAALADAAVTLAKIAATGTRDATTFLRGDGTFAVPAGGGGAETATYTTQNARTASFTIAPGDHRVDQNVTMADAGFVTIPSNDIAFPNGYEVPITQVGAGTLTVRRASAVMDGFNRANSTSSLGSAETGQAWTAMRGVLGISSGRAYNPSGTLDSMASIDAAANGFVQGACTDPDGGTGLLFRVQDADNHYILVVGPTSFGMYKRVAGTYTEIGTTISPVAGGGPSTTVNSPAAGDTFRVDFNGSSITASKNGVTYITATDTTYASQTRVGIRFDNATGRWDDFAAGAQVPAVLSEGSRYKSSGPGAFLTLRKMASNSWIAVGSLTNV